MNFAQILDALMKENNISAYRLSKALDVHQTTIRNWLDGNSQPRSEHMQKLADFFNTSIDYLTGYDDSTKTQNINNSSSASLTTEITPVTLKRQIDLINKLTKYEPEITWDYLSTLCRNERIHRDITEKKISQKTNIPLDKYLSFELKTTYLHPEEVIRLLNTLNLNSGYVLGYLEGGIANTIENEEERLNFLKEDGPEASDFLNKILAQIVNLSPEQLEMVSNMLRDNLTRNCSNTEMLEKALVESIKKRPQHKPEADS